MNKPSAYHIMRVAMGITFAWVGILIFKEPASWGGFVHPWAAGLLPVPLATAMVGTAILDLAIGLALLMDAWVWIVSAAAAFHLAVVLAVSGIDPVTVRDIGLLGAAIMLFWEDAPASVKDKFRRYKH